MPAETPEGRMFAGVMTYPHGMDELRVEVLNACDCGCGRPDRVEFTLSEVKMAITDPAAIDTVIETLRKGRNLLWGEPR